MARDHIEALLRALDLPARIEGENGVAPALLAFASAPGGE